MGKLLLAVEKSHTVWIFYRPRRGNLRKIFLPLLKLFLGVLNVREYFIEFLWVSRERSEMHLREMVPKSDRVENQVTVSLVV